MGGPRIGRLQLIVTRMGAAAADHAAHLSCVSTPAHSEGDGVLDYAELCAALGFPMAAPVLVGTPVIPIAQVSAIQSGEQPKVKVPTFKGDENSLMGKVERVRTALGIEEGTIVAVVDTAVDMLGIADKVPENAKLVEKVGLCFAELCAFAVRTRLLPTCLPALIGRSRARIT